MSNISIIVNRISIGIGLYVVDPLLLIPYVIFLAERGFIYLERIRKIKETVKALQALKAEEISEGTYMIKPDKAENRAQEASKAEEATEDRDEA